MEGLERIVLAHPFFAGLDPKLGEVITGCVRNHRFDPGQYLFHEGDAANEFFLIRHGSVALEILPPGQPAVVVSTEHGGRRRWHLLAGSAVSVAVRCPRPRTGSRYRYRRQMPARQMRGR